MEGSCVWLRDIGSAHPSFELGPFNSVKRVRFAGGCWVAIKLFCFGGIINSKPQNELYHT